MICRLCLDKSEEFLEIFADDGKIVEGKVVEVIENHFQIVVQFNDNVSNKICFGCWQYLNEFHQFWLSIKKKQQTLQKDLAPARIKNEDATACEQINSTFEYKNLTLCEPELIIHDIKKETDVAAEVEMDDAMNDDSLLLPFDETSDKDLVWSRQAIFDYLFKKLHLTFNEQLDILHKKVIEEKCGHYEIDQNTVETLRLTLIKMRQKWNDCCKIKDRFLQKNANWLGKTITIKQKACPDSPVQRRQKIKTDVSLGRPILSFQQSSERSKRRKTAELQAMYDASELTYATQVCKQQDHLKRRVFSRI